MTTIDDLLNERDLFMDVRVLEKKTVDNVADSARELKTIAGALRMIVEQGMEADNILVLAGWIERNASMLEKVRRNAYFTTELFN